MVEYTTAGFLSVVRKTTVGVALVWTPKFQLAVVVVTSHVLYLVSVPVDAQTEMVSLGGLTGTMQDDVGSGIAIGAKGGV